MKGEELIMSSILMLKLMRYKQDIAMVLIMVVLTLGFIFIFSGPAGGVHKYSILVALIIKLLPMKGF